MRPTSGDFNSYLQAHRFYVLPDLYTFRLQQGASVHYSAYALPFTVAAGYFDTYSLNAGSTVTFFVGPRFGRTKVTTKIGVQVDTLSIQMMVGAGDLIGSLTWQQAVINGVLDNAFIELGRLLCEPAPGGGVGPIHGYVVWFQGRVGDVEAGRTMITLTVNSTLTMLSTQYPRRLWQHDCSHAFGDAMCQFDRQSMASLIQAQAGSTQTLIVANLTPNPANLYTQGTAVGVSGQNTGYTQSVGATVSNGFQLNKPFIYPIAPGDAFNLLPGCDHRITTCQNVFNNLGHFGGQPYIPPAEFAV